MKVILFDQRTELASAWKEAFADESSVEVTTEDFRTLVCDAIVSPANSFGYMDGGLDLALSDYLGWDVQKRLQKMIQERQMGELLVGEALLVPTLRSNPRWVVSAPTMRVPMRVKQSVNAYLAMKALLIACRDHSERIDSVAVPGLATGVGGLAPQLAAHQMHVAYREVMLGAREFPTSIGQAQQRHIRLNTSANLSG
jgi:O-acetyl-ADP-ribose deacetylase (regulator of RNase III)